MPDQEFGALVEDIRRYGVRQPILIDGHGRILDGRHRYQACERLAVECPATTWNGTGSALEAVVSANLHRRHLTKSQRAALAVELLPLYAEEARTRQGTRTDLQEKMPSSSGQARDRAGAAFGVSGRYVEHARDLQKLDRDLFEAVKRGDRSLSDAQHDLRRKRRLLRVAVPDANLDGLVLGDFREKSDAIASGSADLVLADPPYARDAVGLYGDAAQIAKRILRPGGSLLIYSGTNCLPKSLAACSEHLDYFWLLTIQNGERPIRMRERMISVRGKHLGWFVKGSRGSREHWVQDFIESPREKGCDSWQQSVLEARYFIEKLCPRDGIVVDFFAGTGTVPIAAESLGRRWAAFEQDEGVFRFAGDRIAGARAARETA
jgi:ParB-like chromosome segregation protein Spo0J